MRIAILTSFKNFNPGYSLTTIVQDQIRMLSSYDHEVSLFVDEEYSDAPPLDSSFKYSFCPKIPTTKLIDYKSRHDLTEEHHQYCDRLSSFFINELKDFDLVFTHDFVFTGWNMPYSVAIKKASPHMPSVKWLHWVHSIPTAGSNWWSIREYGTRHKIVFPNKTDSILVADQFRGKINDVKCIPHIKDLRSLLNFSDTTCQFIKDNPKIFEADIVQVYPASSDRLKTKGVDKLMMIMAEIEKKHFKTFTVIINQHANKRTRKEDVTRYELKAKRNGLDPNSNFIFTSSWNPELDAGLPQREVMELFQCSNLFIYPTREESFGLIGLEAVLSGSCITLLNKSLAMMLEVHGGQGAYFDFGSYTKAKTYSEEPPAKYLSDFIISQYRQNVAAQHKTFIRRRYNWDYMYHHDYLPILTESELWK